tara:strand:- start:423 stop:1517 length:1095 start_codon:yes stop_codon:yes gene_type:complete
MKKLTLLLLLIPHVFVGQNNIFSINSEVGLNVRDKPGIDGKKIATLLVDDMVYLLEKTDLSLTINDLNKSTGERKKISGHWARIETLNPPKLKGNKVLWNDNFENIEGYVFDGFLKNINLKDTINSAYILINNDLSYHQKKLFTGKTITVKSTLVDEDNIEVPNYVLIKTYLNGLKYRETQYYQYWTNPCIVSDNLYFKNGTLMKAGLNKDCVIWDYTYYYENGRIKSQNTEGGAYTGRREHTEWYDNGNLKYSFGKANASIEIMETEHHDAYKTKSFEISPDNLKKYNIKRFMINSLSEKRWFYRNGEKEKTIKFIDNFSLENYGGMGSQFFIEINGKAINLDESHIFKSECWDEKGIKINCT